MRRYLTLLALLGITISSCSLSANPWEEIDTPYGENAGAIGSYANGCLQGGQALPLTGEGYQVLRTERQRYYGHSTLVEFVSNYASALKLQGLDDVLIADMSMPRGGNFTQGHSSHQIGLDVDIWFKQATKPLTKTEREQPKPLKLVDKKKFLLDTQIWSDAQTQMVKTAAEDKRVARIFVSPVIKQHLCDLKLTDDSWLKKVRPWWGHTYHMHVRLHCPEGDTLCQNQAPIGAGNGCNELSWWKQQLTGAPAPQPKKPAAKPKKKKPKVKPQQCSSILAAK
ncbi:penicillin-insensitive murein endopeptidase [Shewanella sp. 1CM18E]|uniref:penicillin-insensitive murein endopeptidase n=1 Tax=Shewanella sp. 1CM18E TaxID=2929169 RepID=UPI0020BEBCFF|nr:penicillin-insensitive murein endopeptidase [Shewanella sp. 1CM18E]MCK8044977.1 penicillin-insensitive murein endopeptidase [Shewanella sp. 1CM18E]